jgi:hypothetical protein
MLGLVSSINSELFRIFGAPQGVLVQPVQERIHGIPA